MLKDISMYFNSIDMEEIVLRVSRIIKKIYSMGGLYFLLIL